QNKPTLQIIKCGQYCFQILCLFISVYSNNSQLISDMLLNFVHDFCNQINSDNSESVFSSKNLLFGGSSVYFSILRALSSHNFGQKLIEQTGLGQRFFDLLLNESASPELIKLSIVSFNYFPLKYFENNNNKYSSRILLEHLLISSKNINIRKWCTRFIGSFFTLNQYYFSFKKNFEWSWPLKLLFRQLSDPSPKVVNVAIRLLIKHLYFCPLNVRNEIREQIKLTKLETLGDAGILLEVFLFDEDLDTINEEKEINLLLEIALNSLNKWNEYFYIQYYEIITEKIRRSMLNNCGGNGGFCYKRSKNGDFARSSGQLLESSQNYRKERVFPPPHLYGHLARSKKGQNLLFNCNIITNLECIIYNFLQNGIICNDSKNQKVKGALFALAQIIANLPISFPFSFNKYTNLLIECVLQQNNINNNNLPWLTIKGCAIWAINIAASTQNIIVIKTLFEAGWEFGESFNNNIGKYINFDFVPLNKFYFFNFQNYNKKFKRRNELIKIKRSFYMKNNKKLK
ncbi:hypothetical protein Mgra_00000089, partial [Meloidogyne graminicola]